MPKHIAYYLGFALALLLILIGLSVAQAAPAACGPRDMMVAAAEGAFKELPSATGQHKSGNVFELLLSDKGSWTLLITRPDGMTCVMASGVDWEQHRIPGQGA